MQTGGREGRGVYVAPHTIEGHPVLYAVTRRGDRLRKVVVLKPGVDAEAATAWLEQQLDIHDPQPTLTLHRRSAPADEVLGPPESATQYAMRLARHVQKTRPLYGLR